MKRNTVLVPAAVLAVLAIAYVLVTTGDGEAVSGRAVYMGAGYCHGCHGADARGTPLGPDLTDGEWLNIGGSRREIARIVRTGVSSPKRYSAPMPPMGGGRLTRREIDAVAGYIADLGER
jgi:mono/diheme cytochrome c family protein